MENFKSPQKRHINIIMIVLLLAVIIVVGMAYDAYFKNDKDAPSLKEPVQIRTLEAQLHERNNSGIAGHALIVETKTGLEVSVSLNDPGTQTLRPVHIHKGICEDVGEIVYPLAFIENGRSETVLDATFNTLLSELPLAANVHASGDNLSEYIACGNIPEEPLD